MVDPSLADPAARLAEWCAHFRTIFGVEVTPDSPQVSMSTRSGVEILVTPVPHLGAIFLTASLMPMPRENETFLAELLAANLFQVGSGGGWFALSGDTRQIEWQIRWDRFASGTAEDFTAYVTTFAEKAGLIRQALLDRLSAEATRTVSDDAADAGMIRI